MRVLLLILDTGSWLTDGGMAARVRPRTRRVAGRAARGGRGGERTPSPGREEAPEAGEAEDEGETGGGQKGEAVDGGEEESGEAETDGARTEAASRERETGARGGGNKAITLATPSCRITSCYAAQRGEDN